MATIVLGSYMVRYPLGGMMSWVLQYLAGFHALGHDVVFVEKSGWDQSCFDPRSGVMTNDCTHGVQCVSALLESVGLGGRWCYVDASGRYHGLQREEIESVFRHSALFVEMGSHEAWVDESQMSGSRVLVDGDPWFTQAAMVNRQQAGEDLPKYDAYFSVGQNIGRAECRVPTAGVEWRALFHPVVMDLFRYSEPNRGSPFTTVMNWRSYDDVAVDGVVYGQKDVEFQRFLRLPALTDAPLEVAVAGDAPYDLLESQGWMVRNGQEVTTTVLSFWEYIRSSAGEFSVCKNGYVRTRSGWFSDRSAAYLAMGRPCVVQDTGFSQHLPCGAGLFAVSDADEAGEAIERILAEPKMHSRAARRLARDHLASGVVLAEMLDAVGI